MLQIFSNHLIGDRTIGRLIIIADCVGSSEFFRGFTSHDLGEGRNKGCLCNKRISVHSCYSKSLTMHYL